MYLIFFVHCAKKKKSFSHIRGNFKIESGFKRFNTENVGLVQFCLILLNKVRSVLIHPVGQCLIMACPCAVLSSAPGPPLGSLIITYCLCCFLGRRDDTVQTPSLASPSPPSLLPTSLSISLYRPSFNSLFPSLPFVSHAAAAQ